MQFKIGQRVRIKWSKNFPELGGTEGTVMSCPYISVEGEHTTPGILVCEVSADLWGGSYCPYSDNWFCPATDQLEPLQNDGRKVVEWSECLWQPEGMTA